MAGRVHWQGAQNEYSVARWSEALLQPSKQLQYVHQKWQCFKRERDGEMERVKERTRERERDRDTERRQREIEREREGEIQSFSHLSVHQWVRSHAAQQPTSPIGFLSLKLPPPPRALLLAIGFKF